jgi:membrane protein YdbS with pleckstrin-like domain
MIYETVKKASVSSIGAGSHPSATKIIAALSCMLVFVSILKRSTHVLEKLVLILSSLFFLLWALDGLAAYGYRWASVPDNLMISTGVCAFTTTIVGLRALEVNFENHHISK